MRSKCFFFGARKVAWDRSGFALVRAPPLQKTPTLVGVEESAPRQQGPYSERPGGDFGVSTRQGGAPGAPRQARESVSLLTRSSE